MSTQHPHLTLLSDAELATVDGGVVMVPAFVAGVAIGATFAGALIVGGLVAYAIYQAGQD
jgi:hypothetical protein